MGVHIFLIFIKQDFDRYATPKSSLIGLIHYSGEEHKDYITDFSIE